MKKNVLAAVMAGIMAVGALAGCGSSSSGSAESAATDAAATEAAAETESTDAASGDDLVNAMKVEWDGEPVELTFWYLSTRGNSQAICDAWNEANPDIQVKLALYDTDGIKDACKTAAQSNSMPSMWFNWGGALGQYYVDNGLTYDLTQYAADHDWENTLNAGALALTNLSGQISGYPTSYNVIGMFYRKDIFEQYGIEVPTTMEEFDQVCATLKENGVTPISTAGLNGWHPMRLIEQFIEYYAGTETHDSLQALTESWENEAVVKGLAKYQEYCEKGYFPDGFVTASPDDTKMAIEIGSCAMDIQGQWYDGTVNADGFDASNLGWFPFPNGTNRMSAFAEMTQFNANLTDEELEAAILFTETWFSDAVANTYPDDFNLPLPYAGATLADTEHQPHVMEMLDYSSENGTFTITDQGLPSECADVLFSGQDGIANGEMTPEEVAANVQAAIEAYKAK